MDGGWIAVEVKPNPGGGALIGGIIPDSNASAAGLREHDVILSVAGKPVTRASDVALHASQQRPGEKVSVLYQRETAKTSVTLTLEPIPSKDELMRRRFVGRPAPTLQELERIPGVRVPPGALTLRGKVTVLEFWASWCSPCRVLSKVLHEWERSGTAKNKLVLGISTETVEVASRAAREMQMSYPIFRDSTGAVTKAYYANSLPTLFIIDREGVVRDAMVGYDVNRLQAMGELVETLASQPPHK